MVDGSLNWIVAKVVLYPKNLTREKSALRLLWRTGVVPEVLDAEILGEKCQARTLVMPFLGDRNMFDLIDSSERRNVSVLAGFMVRALEIIKLVHSEGIVHGDVHMGNFVFWDSAGRGFQLDRLKLTGFGHAAYFKDLRTGLHIPHSRRKELLEANEVDKKKNISLLSRFDLQGWIPTRRDDLYRLSEIFIALLGFPESVIGRATTVLDDKIFRDRNLEKLVLPIFANFHRYCTQLSFEADPNYDFWINQFKKLN
jgi:casein kinase 1